MKFAAPTFFFLFLLASAAFAAAADEAPPSIPSGTGVIFGTATFSDGKTVSNLPVVILSRSNDSETISRLVTDSSGHFVLSLGNGKYELDALLADSATAVIDHAATAQVDTTKEENVTLVFYPAGSVAGAVQLSGASVGGAKVKVACPSSGFDYARVNGGAIVQAGEAGDFIFKALPVGTCQISATTDSLAGTVEVQVAYEKTISVLVEVTKKAAQGEQFPILLVVLAVAVILVAAYFASRALQKGKNNPRPHEETRPAQQVEPAVTPRKAKKNKNDDGGKGGMQSKLTDPKVKAVLATLTDRESEIVRFLFKAGGRAKRSQLQHKLLIPKTSLLRNLRSLERKRIVKLTPFGRNLLAEIDDWLHE
ncbi:MAG: hypothetical protein NTV88_00715 [Candidatus Micrarchaeota archaeon]|nr:hypothetical protein [Candidatus Micrarchaeota archaeon]